MNFFLFFFFFFFFFAKENTESNNKLLQPVTAFSGAGNFINKHIAPPFSLKASGGWINPSM